VNQELNFELILIVLFTAFSIIRINYNLKARRAGYRTVIEESKLYSILLSIFICYEVFTLFLYLLFPQTLSWGELNLPYWLRWAGPFFGFCSLALFVWVHKNLGANFSRKIRIAEEQRIVTSGPYRFLRHPMYAAFYLLHLAMFFLTSNWFLGASWTVFLTVIIFMRINREEKLLIEKFKEEYLFYMQRTGRFIPVFWKRKKKAEGLTSKDAL
jgi:protein-S-isoprenylcysteine O-methyltransferase Ste14